MESGEGVEQLSSSEVVVSISGIQEKIENFQLGYIPVHTEIKSSSSQLPKSSDTKNVTEGSSKPPHPISPLMASTPDVNEKIRKGSVRTTSMIEKVPNDAEDDDDGDDSDDGTAYLSETVEVKQKKDDKWKFMHILELAIFVLLLLAYIISQSAKSLRHDKFWGLEIWRWCVLLLAIFCGRLLTVGFTNVLVFLIERNFMLKKKVVYFVHSLKRSVQVFFWLALVLLTWVILIRKKLKEPKETTETIRHVTRFLVSSLFGAGLWVVKTFLVKILACSFHVKRFFDRIQNSIFHQYILLTLSGAPTRKNHKLFGKMKLVLILKKLMKGKIVEKQTIDVKKLSRMVSETVSSWTISGLLNVIQASELSTISNVLDESVDITSEEDAKRAGNLIFTNVSKAAGQTRFIDEKDLLLFLNKEDVDKVFTMFKGSAESRTIKRTAMRNWVVKVYKERESLARSINDAKTAIEEMNKVLSGLALIVIIVVWLVLMDIATTKMLVLISTQLLAATFIFGNSFKTGFECILYIFVMHPYDIGDRCIVDQVEMTVVEMNILTTVFESKNVIIVYPNSVLATKPISNLSRSPNLPENVGGFC